MTLGIFLGRFEILRNGLIIIPALKVLFIGAPVAGAASEENRQQKKKIKSFQDGFNHGRAVPLILLLPEGRCSRKSIALFYLHLGILPGSAKEKSGEGALKEGRTATHKNENVLLE
ncbi:hypothetical protein [Trichloromonas sp.]|uniref:hypothetical protein n=1 Tax=Trichloromonas sp. TaxID=3069249 RepID=UPI003D81527B